ncbi:unnamed protein product [Prunus armeniaca]|uniref:Uncharacterized protein n=1 Tax=Prunus armeniaca TaxID=36596 RepID=A0A6J5W393_PRUAR|nr:unnamed protein product [Prunus armeniaca]
MGSHPWFTFALFSLMLDPKGPKFTLQDWFSTDHHATHWFPQAQKSWAPLELPLARTAASVITAAAILARRRGPWRHPCRSRLLFGFLAVVLAAEVEEGEGGLGAGRALEVAEGGIGGDACRVRDGRAHDLVTYWKGLLVEVEADRAEEAWVVLEDAVGAELTINSSVADVVEEPPLCGAADARVAYRV